MTFTIIPWRDSPSFSQSLKLSGDLFTLVANWNTTHEYWTLDIYDKDEVLLLSGQKIVINTDILARQSNAKLPLGRIFAIDSGNAAQKIERIGRNDIGVNIFIVYEI